MGDKNDEPDENGPEVMEEDGHYCLSPCGKRSLLAGPSAFHHPNLDERRRLADHPDRGAEMAEQASATEAA